MQCRIASVLATVLSTTVAFAQTSDPTYVLTVEKPLVGNTPGFYADALSDGTFRYGVVSNCQPPYVINHEAHGSATAVWKITRTSPTNPGLLGVVIKCKTTATASASVVVVSDYFGPPTTTTWNLHASVGGLYHETRSISHAGTHVGPIGGGYHPIDSTNGFLDKPDMIIQLSSSSWSRVGTTDVWEAEIRHPVSAEANSFISISGNYRATVTASG